MAAALHLLKEFRIYSLNARNPQKGEGQQPLHADVPRTTPTDWRVVNSMVMLDDMTETNGPTRVVPGSHNWVPLNVPDVNMAEVKHIEVRPEDRPLIPEDRSTLSRRGQADRQGRIGRRHQRHIWHGGTRNESGAPRQVLHLAIGRRDIPQQLVEREHLTTDLFERSGPGQRFLLDIEGAAPVVKGYPPRKSTRVWTAADYGPRQEPS